MACAAICNNFKVTLTPTLMLGAITMAMSLAASAISAFCSSVKPVVPMTSLTPNSRQILKCASVPSGRVKSINTWLFCKPLRTSASMFTPLAWPKSQWHRCQCQGLRAHPKHQPRCRPGLAHGLNQHVAHAATCTSDGNFQNIRRWGHGVSALSIINEPRFQAAGKKQGPQVMQTERRLQQVQAWQGTWPNQPRWL